MEGGRGRGSGARGLAVGDFGWTLEGIWVSGRCCSQSGLSTLIFVAVVLAVRAVEDGLHSSELRALLPKSAGHEFVSEVQG